MQHTIHPWRILAFTVGATLAGLGAYGVYEYAIKLEGGQVTYLVLAAPVIALVGAVLPPMAEDQWRKGALAKSVLLWLALLPVMAVIFYASAERVHMAKAGQSADITARAAAVQRAESELKGAREALTTAIPAENKANAIPQERCGPQCRTAKATAQAARERVTRAEQALVTAQSQAITASPLRAPVWLLPAVLDLVAFMGIWIGLSGPWVTSIKPEGRPKQHRKRKGKAAKPHLPKRKVLVPANVNVIPLQPGA